MKTFIKRASLSVIALISLATHAQIDYANETYAADDEFTTIGTMVHVDSKEVPSITSHVYFGKDNGVKRSQLKRPIIILEGFDLTNETGRDDIYERLIINKKEVNQIDFAQVLINKGYDIIIVDYGNGKDFIQNNASCIENLINHVNTNKVGLNKTVLLGASMGGIVAKYALLSMENKNIDHQVSCYISFDSPHQGANIPFGVQRFLAFFSRYDNTASDNYEGLTSFAAKQLLINHQSASDNYIHIKERENQCSSYNPFCEDHYVTEKVFIVKEHEYRTQLRNELIALGNYPTLNNIRNVAISNGSSFGGYLSSQKGENDNYLGTNTRIIEWDNNSWDETVPIKSYVWSVPDYSLPNDYYQVFHGFYDSPGSDEIEHNDFLYRGINFDNAQGGYYNATGKIEGKKEAFDILTLGTAYSDYPNHSFIPTTSSIDLLSNNGVGQTLIDPSISFDKESFCSNIPFDDVYLKNGISNDEHVTFTEDIQAFILKQLDIVDNDIININDIHYSDMFNTESTNFPIEIAGEVNNQNTYFTTIASGGYVIESSEYVSIKPGAVLSIGGDVKIKDKTICALNGKVVKRSFENENENSLEALKEKLQNENIEIDNFDLKVFPNPTSGFTTLYFNNQEEKEVQIRDLFGKLIDQYSLTESEMIIDLNNQPPGVYIVNVFENELVYSKKVIKK